MIMLLALNSKTIKCLIRILIVNNMKLSKEEKEIACSSARIPDSFPRRLHR